LNIINNDDFYYYFHIEISSLIGIAEKEKNYQAYQIWIIQRMIGNPRLLAVKEDKERKKLLTSVTKIPDIIIPKQG
ncbi:hypothetical protein Goshw_022799, partial [Gossypium schwendimanii]|nr:hypothetical protein [Gossypium schwendimanii]